MKFLSRLEEIYLVAIWKLDESAYGVRIRQEIEEMTGKKISYGALYFTLEQLFKKGYVARTAGQSARGRGGSRRIYYWVTKSGAEQMKKAAALQQSLWKGISISEIK